MKNKKICLFIFIFIFYFSFLLQENNTFYNKQDDKDNGNIILHLSANNTMVLEWYKTWGGSSNDEGNGVAVDSKDNIYVVGYTSNFGAGNDDIVLVKYNSLGVQEWNKTWGGSSDDEGNGIAVDSKDNIYIVGSTNSFGAGGMDIYLVKCNSIGEQEWSKTWGGSYNDEGKGVAIDSFDNVYIVGRTDSLGELPDDIVIVKYNSLGIQEWNKTWGGNANDLGYGVTIDSEENIYVGGGTYSFGSGDWDMVLVKYNNFGEQQWNKTWGGSAHEEGFGLASDSSDNIYITGSEGYDIALVKYNSAGVQEWNKTWGGSDNEEGFGLAVDSSDNIYITGCDGGDIVLVKCNSAGVQELFEKWNGGVSDYGRGIVFDSYENLFIVGKTSSSSGGDTEIILLKHAIDSDSDGLVDWQEVNTYLTDPNKPDTDSDGLTDGQEVNIYLTDPIKPDTDDDGLTDGQEINTYLTDPNKPDTDDDGLTDGQEVNTYLTDPNKPDTDSDGLTDGQEVNTYSTDPNDSDSDGDGLSDGQEVNIYFTDPTNPDSDGDGFSDGIEIFWRGDPNDAEKTPLIAIIIVCVVLTSSIIIPIFIIISHKRKKEKREIERLESLEIEIKKDLAKIQSLLDKKKFNESIKKLEEYKKITEKEGFTSLIKEIDSSLLNSKSLIKKEKQENIKKDLAKIQSLLDENKFIESIKKLEECKRTAEREDFSPLIKEIDALSLNAKSHFKEFKIFKIKKTVLDLGTKFTRLKIIEIAEKCDIKNEQLIIDTVLNMIEKNEIYADYFSISKSIAFNQQANIEEIDRLMAAYKDWEEKKVGKK